MPVEIDGKLYSWDQPICDPCWHRREPDREPVRVPGEYVREVKCAYCGTPTTGGIYRRADPRTVAFPALETDE